MGGHKQFAKMINNITLASRGIVIGFTAATMFFVRVGWSMGVADDSENSEQSGRYQACSIGERFSKMIDNTTLVS